MSRVALKMANERYRRRVKDSSPVIEERHPKRRRGWRNPLHHRNSGGGNESGAVIILAMVYIVSISLVVGALADWAINDLNNTTKFQSASSLDYAVSSAVQVAIQSIRYTPLMSQTSSPQLGECWVPASGYVSQLTVNGDTVAVWCTTVQNLASAATRVVTFYACASTLTSSSTSGAVSAAGATCAGPRRLPARRRSTALDDL
jgi:hypothetical protein